MANSSLVTKEEDTIHTNIGLHQGTRPKKVQNQMIQLVESKLLDPMSLHLDPGVRDEEMKWHECGITFPPNRSSLHSRKCSQFEKPILSPKVRSIDMDVMDAEFLGFGPVCKPTNNYTPMFEWCLMQVWIS